jgi:hypothetical protein
MTNKEILDQMEKLYLQLWLNLTGFSKEYGGYEWTCSLGIDGYTSGYFDNRLDLQHQIYLVPKQKTKRELLLEQLEREYYDGD